MGIRERLEALERRAADNSAFQVVFVLGGLPDDERHSPGSPWERGLDERQEDFRARILTLCRETDRTGVVVVGGLPLWDREAI